MAEGAPVRLRRPLPRGRLIPLTPLVDVMLILLVFFMVTSSYLNLKMIPLVQTAEDAAPGAPGGASGAEAPLLVTLGGDGAARIRGQAVDGAELARRAAGREVLILPSAAARTGDLVATMEAAAGAARVGIVRVSAR